jgi:hypothetical protein
VDFEVTEQLPIIYSVFVRYWEKAGVNGTVHQLLIDFEKACDSGEKYCTVFLLNLMYLRN